MCEKSKNRKHEYSQSYHPVCGKDDPLQKSTDVHKATVLIFFYTSADLVYIEHRKRDHCLLFEATQIEGANAQCLPLFSLCCGATWLQFSFGLDLYTNRPDFPTTHTKISEKQLLSWYFHTWQSLEFRMVWKTKNIKWVAVLWVETPCWNERSNENDLIG